MQHFTTGAPSRPSTSVGRRPRRVALALAPFAVAALGVSACGSTESPKADGTTPGSTAKPGTSAATGGSTPGTAAGTEMPTLLINEFLAATPQKQGNPPVLIALGAPPYPRHTADPRISHWQPKPLKTR